MYVHYRRLRDGGERAGAGRSRPVAISLQPVSAVAPFLSAREDPRRWKLSTYVKFACGLTLPGRADRVLFSWGFC